MNILDSHIDPDPNQSGAIAAREGDGADGFFSLFDTVRRFYCRNAAHCIKGKLLLLAFTVADWFFVFEVDASGRDLDVTQRRELVSEFLLHLDILSHEVL